MERGIVRKERVGATSVNQGTEGWRPYGARSRDVVIAREAEVVCEEETRVLCAHGGRQGGLGGAGERKDRVREQVTKVLVNRIYKLVLEIEGAVACDSCDAERGFSSLQRIRSKTRNRLQGVHLDAAMSLSINECPGCEDVVGVWSTLKPRRRKVAKKKVVKRDRRGAPLPSSSDEEDFVYDDVVFAGGDEDEQESGEEEEEYMLMIQSGYLVTDESDEE
ncbi:hypothetical protein FOZ63_007140 [Perkinsus olseni]|uniref:Uncharacterized protein n=1 Tax=Perkinsus olseni TaxID=32597 RepID=A0A7J6QTU6_PEROL|nr:hypothetical protein FOZ63_007140 [Perkinsus olseni]